MQRVYLHKLSVKETLRQERFQDLLWAFQPLNNSTLDGGEFEFPALMQNAIVASFGRAKGILVECDLLY